MDSNKPASSVFVSMFLLGLTSSATFQTEYGSEFHQWFQIEGVDILAFKFDPLIPGNIMCSFDDKGLGTVYPSGTIANITHHPGHFIDFAMLNEKEILIVSKADSCLLHLARATTTPSDVLTTYAGNCGTAGNVSGHRLAARLNYPNHIFYHKSNGDPTVLIADRRTECLRTLNLVTEEIDAGICVSAWTSFITNHPFSPTKLLCLANNGLMEVDTETKQWIYLTGSAIAGSIQSDLLNSRYTTPWHFLMLNANDALLRDKRKLTYIEDVFNTSTIVTLANNGDEESGLGRAGMLHDGDRIWLASKTKVAYVELPKTLPDQRSGAEYIVDDTACIMDLGTSYPVLGARPHQCARMCNRRVKCSAFLHVSDRCFFQANLATCSGGIINGTCYRRV